MVALPRSGLRTCLTPRGVGSLVLAGLDVAGLLLAGLGVAGLGLATGGTAEAALLLNEALIDPVGADRGLEWIELANSGPWEVSLDGVALEAREATGEWRSLWAGRASDAIGPGQFLTVGGAYGPRPPDLAAAFTLRNEGAALRLRKSNLVLDTIAWGDAIATDEGPPAPRVPSGRSLARREDGVDTDRNRDDLEAQAPTPGRANRPPRDLAVTLRRPGRALPLGPGTRAVSLRLRLENRGRIAIEPFEIGLTLRDSLRLLDPPELPTLAPGESVERPVLFDLAGARLVARAAYAGDLVPENDADTLRVASRPAPLRFIEVMARPDTSGAEWIELQASQDLSLAGWAIEDASGTRLTLRGAALARDSLLVLRGDPSATDWDGRWPSLNDRAGKDGAADSLFLFDPSDRIVDWAVWGDGPRGRSWTRDPSTPIETGLPAWRSGAPTPGWGGEAERIAPAVGLAPPALSLERHPDGTWLKLADQLFPGRFDLRVIGLDGRVVFQAGGEGRDRAERWLRWNGGDAAGRPCAAGVYIVDLDARPAFAARRRERTALVLDR